MNRKKPETERRMHYPGEVSDIQRRKTIKAKLGDHLDESPMVGETTTTKTTKQNLIEKETTLA